MSRRSRILSLTAFLIAWAPASQALAEVPSIKAAEAQLKSGDAESVFESFRAIGPGQHPEGDAKVAALLLHAARTALAQKNGTLAFDIADKASQLDPKNVNVYLVAADAALMMGNAGFARSSLQAGLEVAPDNVELKKRIARLDEDSTPEPSASSNPVRTTEEESGVAGQAARSSEHFRIIYSEGKRDFAQKAQYEQRCLDLFERAYQRVVGKLGHNPPERTDVVLYTKEEFALHFGGSFGNNVLGFFAGKIRMNRAEVIDDEFFDTAVHEFTHAVIDSIAGGQSHGIPFWLHEGLARWVEKRTNGEDLYGMSEKLRLKHLAQKGALPPFEMLTHHSFGELGDVAWVAYSKSAVAVDLLMLKGAGIVGLKRVIAAVGKGAAFDEAFGAEFGRTCLGRLDEEVASTLSR
jgi:tetratricopeptide (TPR) repeat protein